MSEIANSKSRRGTNIEGKKYMLYKEMLKSSHTLNEKTYVFTYDFALNLTTFHACPYKYLLKHIH
jgi:hypothetical protein